MLHGGKYGQEREGGDMNDRMSNRARSVDIGMPALFADTLAPISQLTGKARASSISLIPFTSATMRGQWESDGKSLLDIWPSYPYSIAPEGAIEKDGPEH